MTTATIRVQIDNRLAQLFASAPADRRAQLGLLISDLIEQFAASTPTSLFALMDEMSREADRNGMTPEVLDAILSDE
jgi:hypothetical protein